MAASSAAASTSLGVWCDAMLSAVPVSSFVSFLGAEGDLPGRRYGHFFRPSLRQTSFKLVRLMPSSFAASGCGSSNLASTVASSNDTGLRPRCGASPRASPRASPLRRG
eukprot:CAMPEP_0179469108 /NCGR_PEP_ID=MMETSP0799-20121207/49886_1 /TAXON_ID=46947 /ORGANISM="Geminigera cryophila, Strain CCMP2564" /LENGTH=108 /DNA_ID=CAMNT_0021275485 /DNA_START=184 /DNA_END=510 /DNA_ORIENTATION=-